MTQNQIVIICDVGGVRTQTVRTQTVVMYVHHLYVFMCQLSSHYGV